MCVCPTYINIDIALIPPRVQPRDPGGKVSVISVRSLNVVRVLGDSIVISI